MSNSNRNEFSKLTTKFLFLNCSDGTNEIQRSEINNILNEMNSLQYQNEKFVDSNAAARLFESFTNIPSTEDTLIVKTCCLIVSLVNRQKIQLPPTLFRKTIDWLIKCMDGNFGIVCDILRAMQMLFKNHSHYCNEYWTTFLASDSIFIKLLNGFPFNNLNEYYEDSSEEEVITSIIFYIETLLPIKDEGNYVNDVLEKNLPAIGSKILDIIYLNKFKEKNSIGYVLFITSAINILHRVITVDHEWSEKHLGELFGIGRTFFHLGMSDIPNNLLQKVHVSQQSIPEPLAVPVNKGGKVAKTRKPRTINRNKRGEANKSKPHLVRNEDITTEPGSSSTATGLKVEFENPFLSPFNRTSDSDFSESETGRSQHEKYKHTKLRLSAISLIGILAKNIEKKILYGYWHCIFPSEQVNASSIGLFNSILRDPSPRCRIAALQAASVLLFGSKGYLLHAESSDKTPSSFMPFSISLGNMIVAMYEALTQALSTESSLPVLTQILKCLTVLVQATPFHRLKMGFVDKFVIHIRKLVYHKDSTIQVAALMVMEFLISRQEITIEISNCIDMPKMPLMRFKENQNKLNDSGIKEMSEIEINEEEFPDSDYEEEMETKKESENVNGNSNVKMSWLLEVILENLAVTVRTNKKKITTTPVRIESLQALSSIAPNFLLLKDHLDLVADALILSLSDSQAEVRLYSGKCLDVLGHSINTYLLQLGNPSLDEVNICQQFWLKVLPPVIENVQDSNQPISLKSVLCDFMSNIGVHIYERLPRGTQMQLVSLLSGISYSEETLVRAAAVRALAIYVLFPSLRDDLCFVENTAESIIQLIKDSNLCVRVKASWSMGNISDILTLNCFESKLDRISNDLLIRLFEATIESTNDNDKIRSNSVRTLGNLLRLVGNEHIENPEWRKLCMKSIEKLINCMVSGGNAKVKWNACYAIGNMMRNSSLYSEKFHDLKWQNIVFPPLCKLIKNNANFKVRINGVSALGIISERKHYGEYLLLIWSSLLIALDQIDNLVDFTEYKYRDNLQEQLCMCLSHLLNIATLDDLIGFKNELISNLEKVKENWIRVLNRILPENAAKMLIGVMKIKEILQEEQRLTHEQRNAIQVLSACFVDAQNLF